MAVYVDDVELIRTFKAGDPDAFTHLVGQYRDELFRHALRRLHDPAAAEDALQETFFRAYRSFERLRDDSRLGPWLHQIMANVCIDEANRRQRERDKSTRAGGDPFTSRLTTPGVEQQLGLEIDAGPALDALGSLPETHRNAFTMRFLEDRSYEEIATETGTTEQNVRARVSRARSTIRTALRVVAVLPLLVFGVLRRSSKAALAFGRAEKIDKIDRVDHVHRVATAADTATVTATTMTKVATTMAPAIETANAVAVSAHHAAPLVTKAAIGIGAVALATMSTGPERPLIPEPPTATATATVVAEPDAAPSTATPTPAPSATTVTTAPPTVAPTSAAPPVLGQPDDRQAIAAAGLIAAERLAADSTGTTETPADTPAASPTTAAPTSAPPTTEAVEAPPAPDPGAEEPAPTQPAEPAPPVLHGGSISATGLSATPAGPRTDVSGSVTLTVAGSTISGTLSGRVSIAAEPDVDGRQRLEATIRISTGSGTLDLRLAGHATGTNADPDAGIPATAFIISGQFRLSGGDTVSLIGSGNFSGAFSGSALSINLS